MIEDRIRQYSSSAKALIASPLIYVCTVVAPHYNSSYITLVAVVSSFFIIRQLDLYFYIIMNNFKSFRKWIFGKENIEDFWLDILFNENGQIQEFGIIEIFFRNRQFKVHGDLFSNEIKNIGEFRSKLSSFDGTCLEFIYKRDLHNDGIMQAVGVAAYNFRDAGDRHFPVTFNGEFFDERMKEKIRIKGYRVIDTKDQKTLRSINDPLQSEQVRTLIDQYAAKIRDTNFVSSWELEHSGQVAGD